MGAAILYPMPHTIAATSYASLLFANNECPVSRLCLLSILRAQWVSVLVMLSAMAFSAAEAHGAKRAAVVSSPVLTASSHGETRLSIAIR